MNTFEIQNVLSIFKNFKGVFPCNLLPKIKKNNKFPICFIANYDSNNEKGSHWVAFYIKSYKKIEYFDSFGLPPFNTYFLKFIGKRYFVYNNIPLQSNNTSTCGHFSIYFLWQRLIGKSYMNIILKFDFQNKLNNDIKIKKIINNFIDNITNNNIDNTQICTQSCKPFCFFIKMYL